MADEKVQVYGYGMRVIFGGSPAEGGKYMARLIVALSAVQGFMGYDDRDGEEFTEGEYPVCFFFLLPESREAAKALTEGMKARGEISADVTEYMDPVLFTYK